MKNKVTLNFPEDVEFEDNKLKKLVEKLWMKTESDIQKINTRTKGHTIQLRELEKRLKKLEAKL